MKVSKECGGCGRVLVAGVCPSEGEFEREVEDVMRAIASALDVMGASGQVGVVAMLRLAAALRGGRGRGRRRGGARRVGCGR